MFSLLIHDTMVKVDKSFTYIEEEKGSKTLNDKN